MDKESVFEKIMPIVDNMTLTQLKINQLKSNGKQYGEEHAFLIRSFDTQSKELSKILIDENIPFVEEKITNKK